MTTLILFVIALINLALGIVVFITNSERRQNQQFLLFTSLISLWGVLIMGVINSVTVAQGERLLRVVSYVAAFIPVFFHMLCLSIQYPQGSLFRLLRRAWVTLVLSQLAGALCFTRFFLREVILPTGAGATASVPEAHYGPAFYVYAFYFLAVFFSLIRHFYRQMRRATGLQRMEFQFILLGVGASLVLGNTTNLLIPLLTGFTQTQVFGPAAILAMNLIIAYGIATRKLMEVGYVLRLVTAYALLSIYLAAIYALVWGVGSLSMALVTPHAATWAHLLAAFVIALSVVPVHGTAQRFADRLFVTSAMTDVSRVVKQASEILNSVGTFEAVLEPLVKLIRESVGCDYAVVLLATDRHFAQVFPAPAAQSELALSDSDVLVRLLARSSEPVVFEAVERLRSSREVSDARDRLRTLRAAAAVGIRAKDHLAGIILLGPRLSGRVYGSLEQRALQVVADQLAVALDNARLYTELQDSKLYNDILVDSLISGVIAVNQDRQVTVFNREAQRITRLNRGDVVGQDAAVLPAPLALALDRALLTARGVRHCDVTLRHGVGDETPIELGSSIFYGHRGGVIGALVVFSDVSMIKQLESQVRRSAHLASLGTLSAGMAHEIKNPLVTLKTFSQLLPERFADPEFRATFSRLVGEEVERIDTIVNQLLKFGRPAKAELRPISVHDMLDKSIQLVRVQMDREGIALRKDFRAPADMIQGDPNLLEQSFVNFFLNAVESMGRDGWLTVATHTLRGRSPSRSAWNPGEDRQQICVTVADTGSGIAPEAMSQIFDPFFTTKSNGTGLGLSIAHGIVQDHGGTIEVESEPGRGTTFRVVLPLL